MTTQNPETPFPLGIGSITVHTRRGRAVIIRNIVPDDDDLLVDLYQHLSPETRRLRFLSMPPDLPDEVIWREAVRLSHINPLTAAALIALAQEGDQQRAIGVARLACDPDKTNTAEFAIVLRDDYQREGLGTRLFDLLMQVAMVRGLKYVRGIALAENQAVARLVQKSGLPYRSHTSYGEMTINITLFEET